MEQLSIVKEEPVFHTPRHINAEDDCDKTRQEPSTPLSLLPLHDIKTEVTDSNANKSMSCIKEFDIRKLNMAQSSSLPDSDIWTPSCYTIVYRCSACKHMRRMRDPLRTHEPTCRRDIRMVKCAKCEYVSTILTNVRLHFSRKHDLAAKGHTLFCYHCDYTSSFKSNLAEHIKRNHWVKYETFKCVECPYETKLREYLTKHVQRQHSEGGGSFRCTQCSYRSKYNHHLVQHVQVKHHRVDSVRCSLCPYLTKCKQYLQKHMKRVHGGPIPCPHCQYVAKCGDYLNEHIKKQHFEHWGKSKRFAGERRRYQKVTQCSQCDFTTKYPGDLKAHIQTQHNANCTVYKCERCQYTTKHKTNLHKHVRVKHVTQEFCIGKGRTYACCHCDFKTNYKDHISAHFTGSRQKWLHCRECKFKTDCKGYLEYHKKIADHYKACDSVYKRKDNCQDTVVDVSKSKYVCIHCGFKAGHKLSLNNHFQCKKVTKETFKCVECNFLTKCGPYLKLHIQNNHIVKSEIVIEEEFSYQDFISGEDVKREVLDDVANDLHECIKKEVCETIGSEQCFNRNGFVEGLTIRNIKKEPVTDECANETDLNDIISHIRFEDIQESIIDNIKTENTEYGFC